MSSLTKASNSNSDECDRFGRELADIERQMEEARLRTRNVDERLSELRRCQEEINGELTSINISEREAARKPVPRRRIPRGVGGVMFDITAELIEFAVRGAKLKRELERVENDIRILAGLKFKAERDFNIARDNANNFRRAMVRQGCSPGNIRF